MKRIGSMISLVVLLVLVTSSTCFAAGLNLKDSYPSDGEKGMQPKGVAVKLYFDEDVSAKEIREANEKCFKLVDSKNKEIPLKAFYGEKKPNDVLVIVEKELKSNSEYKFILSEEFQASNGDVLGEEKIIKFKTINVEANMNIQMVLMGVMVVGMIFFTSMSTKKEMQKQAKKDEAEGKVNPYKVAKETGKPVEEVMAQLAKEKAKAEAKAKRRGFKDSDDGDDDEYEDVASSNNKRVKGPRPISEAGSTYVTGRKALAEKAKAEAAKKAAAKNTNPKGTTGKAKNKKK